MSDEQTIYISPDDDLTTVRERLEHIQTHKVTLVVPAQTQLRSHVAWKLLYARVRELNKEVLIVSSDAQVRSVAHAVKFTVANSLESSQQGHSRPTGRPTRSVPTSRTKVANPGPRSAPARPQTRSTNGLRPKTPEVRSWQGSGATMDSQVKERGRTGYQGPVASQREVIDDLDPATFQGPEKKYGKTFDYRVNSAPPIQPLTPDQIEEPDLLLEDYTQAQDIRSAANDLPEQPDAPPVTPRTSPEVTRQRSSQKQAAPSSQIPLAEEDEDPFSYMEDKQFSQSGEQHGNTPIGYDDHNYEHVIRDVTDEPTSIIGDHFEYDILPESRNTRRKDQKPPDTGTKKREMPRTQQRRTGNIAPTPPPMQSFPSSQRMRSEDLDDDDLLPEERSIPERPTRIQTRDRLNEARPQRPRERLSVPLSPAPTGPRKQGPGPYSGQLNRPGTTQKPQQRPITNRNADPARPQTNVRPASQVTANRQRKAAPPVTRQQHNNLPIWIGTAVAIFLILVIFFCLYAIPTTTANITVATRAYSHAVVLTANSNAQAGAVPAQQLSQDFSKQGTETATGSKMVATGKAGGNVCFGNTSAISVTIPTGSIVSTANGVQFMTTAEGVITPQTTCASSSSPPIPVQAVQSGETGNVLANEITVIPNTTLQAIATSSSATAAKIQLTVNNLNDTTGGGLQRVTAVSQQDLANAKTDLHKQLQSQIDTWKKGLPKDGVLGTVVTTDTLINPPKVGDIVNSGNTFPVSVQVKATIMFVKNADIASAAETQLGTTIKTDKNFTGAVLLPQSVTISKLQQQETNNTLMKLHLTAATKVTGEFDKNNIKSSIAGQSTGAAQDLLRKQSSSVQKVEISTNPGFISWVTWYQPHISINIIPGTNTTK